MPRDRIFEPTYEDPVAAAIFSDEQLVEKMLRVEAALARVQGGLGVIPPEAAAAIAAGMEGFEPDFEGLRAGTGRDGLPVVALLAQVRAQVGRPAADYIHWGATTQDILDTAIVLQSRDAFDHFEGLLSRLVRVLAGLAAAHRDTLMAGRTHSQQALPITFGFKVAGWLAPLLRHRERLAVIKDRSLVLQFGGAAGTLAALGERGPAVAAGLAVDLGLGLPEMPWHTQRDRAAETAGWLSMLSGSLAKIAQDVILMAQTEIGEIRESDDPGRGGSSTMPQKHNPVVSEAVLIAARTNAALLAAVHQAVVQEHERGTHGWQLEFFNLARMFPLTGGALRNTLAVVENMVVDAERMAANIESSNGLMLAEAAGFALAEFTGRASARKIVAAACRTAVEENRHLVDVLRDISDAPVDWDSVTETRYLGSTRVFIDSVLEKAGKSALEAA